MLITTFTLVSCDYNLPDDLEATEAFIFEEVNGELWVAGINATCKDTEIVIPDYVKMNKKNKKVVGIKAGAFNGEDQITKIVVPSTVKEIGANAFANCLNLEEVYIDKGVEWLKQSILYNSNAKIIFNGTAKEFRKIKTGGVLASWFYDKSGGGEDFYVYCTDMILIYNCTVDMNPIEEKYEKVSKGLEYSLNADGKSYTVTGIGTCKDTNLIIPSLYNGKPVTSIGMGAFGSNVSLTAVTISKSITSISDNAFMNCLNLTKITFDGTIEQWNRIEKRAEWLGCGNVPAKEVVCINGIVTLEKQSIYTVTKDNWNSNMNLINFTLTYNVGKNMNTGTAIIATVKQTNNSLVYMIDNQVSGYYCIKNGVSYVVGQENGKWLGNPTTWSPQTWNFYLYIEKMQYDDFSFDESRQAYISTKFEGFEAVIKFKDGKLMYMESIDHNDPNNYVKVTFTNLGSTVVDVPNFTIQNN